MRTLFPGFFAAAVLLLAACSDPPPPAERPAPGTDVDSTEEEAEALVARAGAPLFDGMGDYHRTTTTTDAGSQRYFDQGMVLAFGFNHAEAIRSFRAAQRLDDACAMCYWGEALATGPNINVTAKGKAIMSPEDQVAAFAAIGKAVERKSNATQLERDLIDALAVRYSAQPVEDRDPLDRAYATALGELTRKYPADDDIAAMFAEAWMNTMPWNYWSDDATPRPEIVPVIAALETIIARNPRHPLALHLYIHALEASASPARAEDEADTLANLVPGSGHLVHMPAHLYWRVGRYHDAAEANVRAAAVDEAYIAQCNAQGFYPAMYYPHNIHFLWAAASMEGRSVGRDRGRTQGRGERAARADRAVPDRRVLSHDPAPCARAIRSLGRDARRTDAARRSGVLHRDLALRARRRPRKHGRRERALSESHGARAAEGE